MNEGLSGVPPQDQAELSELFARFAVVFEEAATIAREISQRLGGLAASEELPERITHAEHMQALAAVLPQQETVYGDPTQDPAYILPPEPEAAAAMLESAQAEAAAEDPLDALLARLAKTIDTRINIGQIVRELFGGERLERTDYLQFIGRVNAHPWLLTRRGSWYTFSVPQTGPESAAAPATQEPSVPAEEQPASKPETADMIELDELEAAVLRYATGRAFFRMEVMRRELPELAAIDDEPYKDFKAQFANLREKLLGYLGQQGIGATWESTGQARGVRYQLNIEGVDIAEEPTEPVATTRRPAKPAKAERAIETPVLPEPEVPISTVEPEELPLSPMEYRRAAIFTTRLVAGVQTLIETNDRKAYIRTEVAKSLGLTATEADRLLDQLFEAQLVYKAGTIKGSLRLSATPVEVVKKVLRSGGAERQEEFSIYDALTEREIREAERLVEHFRKELVHVQKGETIGGLMRALKTDMTEAEFKAMVRKLEARRWLTLDNSGNYRRARKGTLVKLRSQDFKNRWKGSKDGLLKQLEQPMEPPRKRD